MIGQRLGVIVLSGLKAYADMSEFIGVTQKWTFDLFFQTQYQW